MTAGYREAESDVSVAPPGAGHRDVPVETAAARPPRHRRNLLTRRLPWWGEALIAVAFYWLYDVVQALTGGHEKLALAHGHDIVNAEKSLHIWVEPHVNRWATGHHTLSIIAGYDYGLAHALVTATVLGFLWWRRPQLEVPMRNGLVALSLVALLVYWLYPVAPPRLTVSGLTDTLVTNNILGARHVHEGLVNLYAAMPSLHVAWALWCAAAIVLSLRTRWRHLAWLYPAWTTFVIIATANHYLLGRGRRSTFRRSASADHYCPSAFNRACVRTASIVSMMEMVSSRGIRGLSSSPAASLRATSSAWWCRPRPTCRESTRLGAPSRGMRVTVAGA